MTAKTKSSYGWSFHLGRLLGIDVYIHFTFLLLLAFIGLSHGLAGRSAEAALNGVLFFAGLFVCVLLHEYGHALAARRYGIATRDITLLPIGGVARLERMPDKPSQECVVALAGPPVNHWLYLFSEKLSGPDWRRIVFIGKDRRGSIRTRWRSYSREELIFIDHVPRRIVPRPGIAGRLGP